MPVGADVLVRDAVQAMSGLVQDAEAQLEIGETTSCAVFADTDSIVQVLSNLIENGIKYGRPGKDARSRVVVSAREIVEVNGSARLRGVPGAGLWAGDRVGAPEPDLRAVLPGG